MADSFIQLPTDSTGKKMDTRTEGTNSEHRQVMVIGDPATNAGVAPVDVTNGLAVQIVPAVPAGENHLGEIGGNTVVVATSMTRPADTTAYAANDAVANSTSAPAAINLAAFARINNGSGYITGVKLAHSVDTVTARFRVWFFQGSPGTLTNDNAAFSTVYADKALRIGYVDLPALQDVGDCSETQNFDIRLPFVCSGSARIVYALLQTLDAFTPASAATFHLQVSGELN